MKPAPFEYLAPDSLQAALEIMAEKGEEAKVLAGGQSLLPAMNFRLVQPSLLVDLNRVSELDYIVSGSGSLRIGAMTRQRKVELDPQVAGHAPLVHEAMPYIAHVQIRNRGTIGGSLVHADPAAELPVLMAALEARFLLRSRNRERWVGAPDFYQDLFVTDIGPDEILVEIQIPPMAPRTGWCFVEFARRKGDYALLGLAALLTLDDSGICQRARLIYLNAGEIPIEAPEAAAMLAGERPGPGLFRAAAEVAASDEIRPSGDIHASEGYLRQLCRVLTTRALSVALERAGQAA
jgi:CO/xanthine dehydrogenase FAD-binding subunit